MKNEINAIKALFDQRLKALEAEESEKLGRYKPKDLREWETLNNRIALVENCLITQIKRDIDEVLDADNGI